MKEYPLSQIHPNARIHESVDIGPFVTIQEDVEIAAKFFLGPLSVPSLKI